MRVNGIRCDQPKHTRKASLSDADEKKCKETRHEVQDVVFLQLVDALLIGG